MNYNLYAPIMTAGPTRTGISAPVPPTHWYRALNKYEMPEAARQALEAVQTKIEEIGDKQPTEAQWLALKESMVKYWAVMIADLLTRQDQEKAMNMYLEMEMQRQKAEMDMKLQHYSTTF